MHLSLFFLPNFRGTYSQYDSINSPQYGSCSFRKRSYSSYSYRYSSFSISERHLMKKPSTRLQIPSIGGNAPKQDSLSLGQTTTVLDKRLFRSMMESLRNGLQWKGSFFVARILNHSSVKLHLLSQAASPVTLEILRREAL